VQVAEKLHAYTRTYADGRTSTRVKDLVDLVLIAELSNLGAAELHNAIEAIFALRTTHPTPSALPSPAREWAIPFRKLAEEVGTPGALAAGHEEAACLLDPILSGEIAAGTWSSSQQRWLT
jgi:hypothetical protein